MHAVINNQLGRIHHADCHLDLQKTRPTYCFIPEAFFGESGLDRSRYLESRWPSINAGANPDSIGSHVIPDLEAPANIRSRCLILKEFISRVEIIARVKAPARL